MNGPVHCPTIDVHTHILPKSWPDLRERYGYGGFLSLEHPLDGCSRLMIDGALFREVDPNCFDPAVRIEECDRAGVDVQVLSTVPVMFCYWAKPDDGLDLARILNDHVAQTVRDHPTRFVGLGTLPMQSAEHACRELNRCVTELGLPGVQIGSHVNGKNLNHPEIVPVLEEAARLGAAVFVHPWDILGKDRMEDYWLPWLVGMPCETTLAITSLMFGGVFDRLPDLRICFAHGGGAFIGTLGRIAHGHRVRPDLTAVDGARDPYEYMGSFFLDSLYHDPFMLRRAAELIGPQRIALGTDYPFPLGELEPGELIRSTEGFTEEERTTMLSGSALEFLGVDAAVFA